MMSMFSDLSDEQQDEIERLRAVIAGIEEWMRHHGGINLTRSVRCCDAITKIAALKREHGLEAK